MATKDPHEMTSPCSSCPYRRDAPLAMWSKYEFDNLRMQDGFEFGGAGFDCHGEVAKPQSERGACIGWLLDQRRRNVPSISLRLRLMTNPQLSAQFKSISSGGHALYNSIAEMCEANFPGGKDRPRPGARKRRAKVKRK